MASMLYAADHSEWGWGAQPIIGYDDQEGWTFGASNVFYLDPDTTSKDHEVDELDLTTTVTTRKSFNVHGELTKYLFQDTRDLTIEAGCERSFSRYYGDTDEEDVLVEYKTIEVPFGVAYSISPIRNYKIVPQYELQWTKSVDLKQKTDSIVVIPNFVKEDLTSGIGVSMEYNRTNPGMHKRSGYNYSLGTMYYADWLGSRHNFEIVTATYKHYIPMGKESVLAWHFKYKRGFGDVPNSHMPQLGGHKILRGFDGDKYQGKHVVGAQMEFRFPIFWRFGATAFWGLGNAADNSSDLKKNIHAAGGIGLRFMVKTKQKINVRFDFTYSDDREIQKYIKIKEAF